MRVILASLFTVVWSKNELHMLSFSQITIEYWPKDPIGTRLKKRSYNHSIEIIAIRVKLLSNYKDKWWFSNLSDNGKLANKLCLAIRSEQMGDWTA